MAEAMLGKYDRSSTLEVLASAEKSKRRIYSEVEYTTNSYPKNNRETNLLDKNDERCGFLVTHPKRRRITGKSSAVDIVDSLNLAMSKAERLTALKNAIETFDHNNRDLHDTEIDEGADIALVKTLVFLEFKASFGRKSICCYTEAINREISSVLKCLECIYRASSDAVGKSFNRVGNDLLQILVTLIDEEKNDRLKMSTSSISDDSRSKSARTNVDRTTEGKDDRLNEGYEGSKCIRNLIIRKATKIIGHFARVGKATRPMARFPGFLGTILDLCNVRPYTMIPFEARLSCLWTIANLACNADNMTMMIDTPNLIDSLIAITNRRPNSSETIESIMETLRAQSITSRALLNLSWSLENKVLMSKNPALVQALCRLALGRQAPYKNSKTMQNILVQTRRHSLASLRNICAAPKCSKIALCNYNHGKVLDTLTDVILNETDQSVLNFSFYAIHNLTICETAEVIVDRAALVLALKNVLLEGNDDSLKEDTHTIKCQCASATILALEKAITPDKSSYAEFRELLDTIDPSNPAECTDESVSLNETAV